MVLNLRSVNVYIVRKINLIKARISLAEKIELYSCFVALALGSSKSCGSVFVQQQECTALYSCALTVQLYSRAQYTGLPALAPTFVCIKQPIPRILNMPLQYPTQHSPIQHAIK